MIPTVTVKVPQHPLTQLSSLGGGAFWPAPPDTAIDRDPTYDAAIVIWDPWVTDQATGVRSWVGGGDGLALPVGTGQAYTWINLDGAVRRGHRNVFKHEFGHSITWFFDAAGTAPKPAVDNHANPTTNVYVHCGTGASYSGTTARPTAPNTCLGVTPQAWAASSPTSLNPSAAARTRAPSNATPVT